MSISRKLESRRELKRNPSGSTKLDGALGIELGQVLELEAAGQVVRTGRARPSLLWFPSWKALVFFEGVKKSANTAAKLARLSEQMSTKRAESTFEKWAQREAKKAHDVTFPAGARKWYAGGAVTRIDYRSDKWGETAEYTHDFGRGVKLYILSTSKDSAMWVIRGGKMTVTARGIVR